MEDPIVSHSDEGSPVKEQDTSGHMLDDNEETMNEETLREAESPVVGGKESENDQAEEKDTAEDEEKALSLGGAIETPAFCLLDGLFEDPKESAKKRVTVPINRLPAMLGRTHNTVDKGFFGLGKVKALSREQCRIDYRTPTAVGGQLEQDDPKKDAFTLKRNVGQELSNPTKLDLSNKTGFFVITCMGKNRITVNGERVEQGQTAVLPTGSTLRISHYSLYFFLPTKSSTKTMQIPDTAPSKKRKSASTSSVMSSGGPPSKKSKIAAGGWPTLQAELDSMSVDALLEHLEAGIETENWDRRQQLVGSTLSYRAVLSAARSKIIQASAKANGGASRSEIMNWIEKSEKFGKWRALMLTKLEIKSYQASITKALIRAEFERTGTSGRYIKWLLPKSILKEIRDKKKNAQQDSGDEEDSKQQDTTSSQKKPESEEESGDDEDSKKQDAASQKKQESEEESGDDEESKKQDATSQKKQESEEESGDDEESKKQDSTSQKKPASEEESGEDEDSKKQDDTSQMKQESQEESGDEEDIKKEDITRQMKQESQEESGDDEESKKQDGSSQIKQESGESDEEEEEDNDQDEHSRAEPTDNDGMLNNDMNTSKDTEGDNDDDADLDGPVEP
jgi:hypothetical protein